MESVAIVAERISTRLSRIYSHNVRACVRTCQSRSGMSICTHLHSRARDSCVTCMMMEARAGRARD